MSSFINELIPISLASTSCLKLFFIFCSYFYDAVKATSFGSISQDATRISKSLKLKDSVALSSVSSKH